MGWNAGSHMGFMGFTGFMGFWWIFALIALVAVIWVTAVALRGRGIRGSSAEERLKERYAAGEIDRATYEQVLAELRK
jgi:uncharacterized membrane protein